MSLENATCPACGQALPPAELLAYGRCEDCYAVQQDARARVDRDRRDNTARNTNVPLGVSIRRAGHQPGTGAGNDYFGNHT